MAVDPLPSTRVTLLSVGAGQCCVVEPPSGRVVLGINTFYVKAPRVIGLIARHGFLLERRITQWGNPSQAFVIVDRHR